ncbi:MAG: hypothetical protein WBN34_13110 [Woeseia sp.]
MASVFMTLAYAGTAYAESLAMKGQLDSEGYLVQIVNDWDGLLKLRKSRIAAGLRLTDIELYDKDGGVGFVAKWEKGDDEDYLWRANTWSEFEEKTLELASRELRLVDVEIYIDQGQARYVGVWRSGSGNFALWTCPTWDAFTDKWQVFSMSGLSLIDIEVYRDQSATHYFGLFRSDVSEETLWTDEDWDEVSQ